MKEAGFRNGEHMTLKKKFFRMIYLGIKEYQDPYYQGIPEQIAFYFILSIFPSIVLLTQLLGVFNLSIDLLQNWFEKNFSSEAMVFLNKIFEFRPQTTTNFFLIIMAIWAASRIQFTLLRVLNYSYSDGQDFGNFWLDRLRSMIAVVVTVIAMVFIFIVLGYGELVLEFLATRLQINSKLDWIWTFLRWPIAGALYFFLIFMNYYMLPKCKLKARSVVPGTIFCAVGMLLVTIFYSRYTTRAVTNNILYGSMASLSISMFWLYFVSWVFVLGIILNKVWADMKEK